MNDVSPPAINNAKPVLRLLTTSMGTSRVSLGPFTFKTNGYTHIVSPRLGYSVYRTARSLALQTDQEERH